MKSKNMSIFYLSAIIAISGVVGYQYFVKRVPVTLNPIVSVIAMYVAVLAISVAILTLFPADGGLKNHFRQLSWIQVVFAGI